MNTKILTTALAAALLAGCAPTDEPEDSTGSAPATTEAPADAQTADAPSEDADGWTSYGAGVPDEAAADAVAAAKVLAEPKAMAGETMTVRGTVASVCKAKGCWITLADGEKSMRVKFEDYAFFLPKDCEGREVVMQGVLSVDTTSEAQYKHYLEDAGKKDEAAAHEGDVEEIRFLASGVELAPAPAKG